MKWTILASFLLAWSAQAQDAAILLVPDESELQRLSASEPRSLCFRGRPLPECRSFLITEVEVGYQFNSDFVGGSRTSDIVLGGEVGWMRNLTNRDAIGAVYGANNHYLTLGPRYRRWLSEATALDVGLSVGGRAPSEPEIVELQVAMMYGDRVGLWAAAARDFGRGENGLAAGIRAGAEPGLVAYGVGATYVIIVIVGSLVGI